MPDALERHLHDAFDPLRDGEIRRDEIDAVLDQHTVTKRVRRRRMRLAAAAATVCAVLVTAALSGQRDVPTSTPTAGDLFRTAAAAAAERPDIAPFEGYRYVKSIDRFTWGSIAGSITGEQPAEQWLAADGRGERVAKQGRWIARDGYRKPPRVVSDFVDARAASLDDEGRVPLQDLPLDPKRLAVLLEEAIRDGRWRDGGARFEPVSPDADAIVRYHVAREVTRLLSTGNATPELRSVLFRVLAEFEGFRAIGKQRDARGRLGDAVEVRSPTGPVMTVIFDTRTSEVLATSFDYRAPGASLELLQGSHTYVETGHVRDIGQRP